MQSTAEILRKRFVEKCQNQTAKSSMDKSLGEKRNYHISHINVLMCTPSLKARVRETPLT